MTRVDGRAGRAGPSPSPSGGRRRSRSGARASADLRGRRGARRLGLPRACRGCRASSCISSIVDQRATSTSPCRSPPTGALLEGAGSRVPVGVERPRQHDRPGDAARPRRARRSGSASRPASSTSARRASSCSARSAAPASARRRRRRRRPSRSRPRSSPGLLAGALWGFIPGASRRSPAPTRSSRRSCSTTIAASVIGCLVLGPLLAPGFSFARTGDLGNAALPIIFGTRTSTSASSSPSSPCPSIWWLLLSEHARLRDPDRGRQPERRALRRDAAGAPDHPHDVPRRACSPASPAASRSSASPTS